MIKREIHKIKTLIVVLIFLVGLGCANIVWGIISQNWVSVSAGLFCGIVSGLCIMKNIQTIERYAAMEVEERHMFWGRLKRSQK